MPGAAYGGRSRAVPFAGRIDRAGRSTAPALLDTAAAAVARTDGGERRHQTSRRRRTGALRTGKEHVNAFIAEMHAWCLVSRRVPFVSDVYDDIRISYGRR